MKIRFLLLPLIIASQLSVTATGPWGSGVPGSPEMLEFEAKWRPMASSPAKMRGHESFNQQKYGMFIHWGLYSQLGGVYKGKKMEEGGTGPRVAEWVMRRKEIPRAEYAKLADSFNPTRFNAEEWVEVAKAAGMKYMVITSKHHDGFALFDSDVSDFNVVDASPFGRDIIRELEQACEKAGIAFGVYYSHSIDWKDGGDAGIKDYGPEKPEKKVFANYFDPAPVKFDDYITHKALPQVQELVDNYKLCEIWLDTPIYIPARHSFAFYKTIYDADPEILVNQRIGNHFGDFGIPGDNVIPDQINKDAWECVATTNNSWGYKSYDDDWKKPIEILYWLVANVSKGGNLLLNVGPDGRGVMPPEAVANLREVGKWLKVNGAAIYGTKPWHIDHEGDSELKMGGTEQRKKAKLDFNFGSDDFWFTQKENKVYAISLARPEGRNILIKSLSNESIDKIRMLGQVIYLDWKKTDLGVEVQLPDFMADGIGFVVEVTLED